VTPLRRRGNDDLYGGGALEPVYPQPSPDPYSGEGHAPSAPPPAPAEAKPEPGELEVQRPPGLAVRVSRRLSDWRRRVLPLPDEVVDQYLGHGERMIHHDHPSFQYFFVENTLLFLALFAVGGAVVFITFNGSLVTAAFTLLVLSVVLLILVLRRLGERYTSYVVTNVRIMRIKGILSRRAHSIPWSRVTDLTYEQSLTGRMFGYATLHIESANEDSGLRDLSGVSDPVKFNQFVVDMVVAKQGPTAPIWEQLGEPAPIISVPRSRMIDRIRWARQRRRASAEEVGPPLERRRRWRKVSDTPATGPDDGDGGDEGSGSSRSGPSDADVSDAYATDLSDTESDLNWRP
jgi:membrane protein YdbS with pleckstrin-like domain